MTQLKNRGTRVYIQSTLECSVRHCGHELDEVRALNRKLKAYAEHNGFTYIDVNAALASEQEGLLNGYTLDGVHLRGNGYSKWGQAISPYVYSDE